MREIDQAGSASKTLTPFLEKEYAGWRFQGVSGCFNSWRRFPLPQTEQSGNILSREAHVDNRILDIQREKDLMEVSWLGWSMLKLLIRFFNVFFPVWCHLHRGAFARRAGWCSAPTGNWAGSFLCAFHSTRERCCPQRLLNRAGEACSGTARRVETTRSRGGVFCSWWKECNAFHTISINFILLMDEILHHQGWLKSYKQWDNHHPWWCRILSINSTIWYNFTIFFWISW